MIVCPQELTSLKGINIYTICGKTIQGETMNALLSGLQE
jgi:hypothetical protein